MLIFVLFLSQKPIESFSQQKFTSSQGEIINFPATTITSLLQPRQDGEVIFNTNFGVTGESGKLRCPSGWEQFFAVGYPQYIEIEIIPHRSPFGTSCLQLPVQRGNVAIFSPRTEIQSGLTYTGFAYVLASGLKNNRMFISISLLDADGKILKTGISETVVHSEGWFPLATESLTADVPEAHSIAIGLHLVSTSRQDLSGQVEFSIAAIREEPTIRFQNDRDWQIYTNPLEITIRGEIYGTASNENRARLELQNVYGVPLASRPLIENSRKLNQPELFDEISNATLPLASESQKSTFFPPEWEKEQENESQKKTQIVSTEKSLEKQDVRRYEFYWKPLITEPGFYTVTLSAPSSETTFSFRSDKKTQSMSFVLLKPYGTLSSGDFGWSLPEETTIDECSRLKPLLAASGISRLKIPIWLSEQTPESVWQKYMKFCEWLNDHRIEPIGVLSVPPAEVINLWKHPQTSKTGTIQTSAQTTTAETLFPVLASRDFSKAGDVFSLPSAMWLPSMETTVFRLGMVIPEWQLGREQDLSLTDFSELNAMLEQIHSRWNQQSLDTSLGLVWDWVAPFPQFFQTKEVSKNNQPPETTETSGDFLALDNEQTLTADDLTYYLDATRDFPVKRYVSLPPLDRQRYSLETRITDLVGRMIAAKEYEADAIFIPHPFDPNFGLFDHRGMPDSLFLPWRTTSLMISGKTPMGSIHLPNQSENHLFNGLSDMVMMVRNNTPTEESLILGKDCKICDVWGKEISPMVRNAVQTVPVSTLPIFVTRLQPDIARIRQNCFLEESNIPSRYDRTISNKLYFTNTTEQTLIGRLAFRPPPGIVFKPNEVFLNLASGETLEEGLNIRLTPSAVSGKQMVQMDVTTNLNDARFFTVYQPVNVGGDDISLDLSTRLNRNNELEVYQSFRNEGNEPVSFHCTLYAPERPLQNMTVKNQGFGRNDSMYTLSNGSALIGKPLRVIAREIRGKRTLKYELTAKP
ncbi:MAG: hypothetical protein LBJ67_09100 [Planctomycetaceae bacterium]|nr:hypothetical protein [Planctomycetaceae bacterium]